MICASSAATSWPGLSRPSTFLNQRFKKIIPSRICPQNESDLPGSRPMLHVLLALNCVSDLVVTFKIDQPLQAITFGTAADESLPMLGNTADDVIGDTDIQRAIRFVRENVNVTPHRLMIASVDGPDKPGHDAERSCGNGETR